MDDFSSIFFFFNQYKICSVQDKNEDNSYYLPSTQQNQSLDVDGTEHADQSKCVIPAVRMLDVRARLSAECQQLVEWIAMKESIGVYRMNPKHFLETFYDTQEPQSHDLIKTETTVMI